MLQRRTLLRRALFALGTTSSTLTAAQWPDRPVTMVIGFPPGGALDMQARDLARPLSAQLRQPVIVDNKPGAGQAIGAEAVARASKEGYIIGLIDSGPLTIGPHLRSLSYDPRKSFTPLGGVNKMPLVILSSIGSGITSLAGLRKFAATSERGVSYGSSGLGSIHHLVGELLRSRLEVDLTHVPYRGSSQALTDLVAGRISIMIAALSSGLPMVRAGQAQAIGVTSPKRSEAAPTIPTLAEQGLDDFDAQGWTGLFAPKDIAPSKAAALSAALQRSLADPDFVQQAARQGNTVLTGQEEELRQLLVEDNTRWSRIISARGIRLE